MNNLTVFEKHCSLAELLIEQSTKEQLAATARILAWNIAQYHVKHSEITLDKTLAMITSVELSDEQLKLAVKGIENLINVLGNMSSGLEEIERVPQKNPH